MLVAVLMSLSLGSVQDAGAGSNVPDVVVTAPRPESVWCLKEKPLPGSRVRRTQCRTHEEWVERVAVEQDQADVLYRQGGRYLMDSELGAAVAEGLTLGAIRRRAAARERERNRNVVGEPQSGFA